MKNQVREVKMVLSIYPLSQPDVGIRLLYLCSKHLQLNKFL